MSRGRVHRGVVAGLLALGLALAGCQSLPFGKAAGDAATPLAAPEVTVETLPPVGAAPGTGTQAPAAGPAPAPDPVTAPPGTKAAPKTDAKPDATPVAEAPPPPPKSASQLACEKRGGQLVGFGASSLKTCQTRTGDGGKQCARKGDCEGECLARTRSCAPVTPLPGCNEVLLADGTRFNLCVN